MARFSLLLSLCLLVGLAACESGTENPPPDPDQLEYVLEKYSGDRSNVMLAIGQARGTELETSRTLDLAAARHALDLAGHRTSTHMGKDGSWPGQRIREAGCEMESVREFIFRVEGDPEDLGKSAAATWLAPYEDNGVLTEPCTHVAVAFAPMDEGGSIGVLLLAQR